MALEWGPAQPVESLSYMLSGLLRRPLASNSIIAFARAPDVAW